MIGIKIASLIFLGIGSVFAVIMIGMFYQDNQHDNVLKESDYDLMAKYTPFELQKAINNGTVKESDVSPILIELMNRMNKEQTPMQSTGIVVAP